MKNFNKLGSITTSTSIYSTIAHLLHKVLRYLRRGL